MSEHQANIDPLAFLNGLASEIERLRARMTNEDGYKALATASSIQSLDAVFNALKFAYRPAPGHKLEVLTGKSADIARAAERG